MPWNPERYLKFSDHRLRPALDLLQRLDSDAPQVVFDLGCGTGNVTKFLRDRWPGAQIVGVDSSSEMLTKAQRTTSGVTWVLADLAHWIPEQPADVIFSNAALHWLDGHSLLFERLARWLTADGILAVQMPHNHHAPSHQGIFETVYNGPWRDALLPLMREDPVGDMAFYWDILTGLGLSVDLWETEYLHVLHGENAVVEWTKSTALTPLLDALGEPDRRAFLRDYSCRMATAYPMREDGATLFPFKRLFLIARRMRATH